MESQLSLGPGLVFPLGKTHFRTAYIGEHGHIEDDIEVLPLPEDRRTLLGEIAGRLVTARADGAEWAVVSMPCPVDFKEQMYGPSISEGPFHDGKRSFQADIAAVSSAAGRLLESKPDFVICANDAAIATHASARDYAAVDDEHVFSLIAGTGNGGGFAWKRSGQFEVLYDLPMEIGMVRPVWAIDASVPLENTYEQIVSSAAILASTGLRAEDLPETHPYWRVIAAALIQQVVIVDSTTGVDVAVISGGVGSGGYNAYGRHMADEFAKLKQQIGLLLDQMWRKGGLRRSANLWNDSEGYRLPRIEVVPPKAQHSFEASGCVATRQLWESWKATGRIAITSVV